MIGIRLVAGLAVLGAVAAAPGAARAQGCEIKIGAVLSVTGSMAAIGKAIADSGQLAVDHANEAGGILGCRVRYVLRDDQGQPNVGVDAAKNLVEVDGVPAIIGAIQTGVSLPILTSVVVPSKVTQISCCSSAPSFTELAKKGQTGGYWFRTLPTVAPQGVVLAKLAIDKGYRKTAVVHVNSDYGVSMARSFKEAYEKLGGTVTKVTPYNQDQASYRTEINAALADKPDSLFLVAFPADGATALREWISFGGTQNLILSNALRADEFVKAVGARFLGNAIGIDNAQVEGPSVAAYNAAYKAKFGKDPYGPGLHTIYDAVAVALLAAEAAKKAEGTAIRDHVRKVTAGDGVEVHPGVEGFKAAKAALAAGKAIRYIGATGAIAFDEWGDVTGPYLIWGVKDGALVQLDKWDNARVAKAVAEVAAK